MSKKLNKLETELNDFYHSIVRNETLLLILLCIIEILIGYVVEYTHNIFIFLLQIPVLAGITLLAFFSETILFKEEIEQYNKMEKKVKKLRLEETGKETSNIEDYFIKHS